MLEEQKFSDVVFLLEDGTRIFTFVVLGKPNICLKKFEAEHRISLCASSFSWPSSSRKTTSENFCSSSIFCQSSANVDDKR
jgi:hypothetical protein